MSWDLSAQAPSMNIPGIKPMASITIDSRTVDAAKLTQFEALVYGTDATTGVDATEATEPTMPTIDKIVEIFGTEAIAG